MSDPTNKALVAEFIDALFTRGELEAVDRYLAGRQQEQAAPDRVDRMQPNRNRVATASGGGPAVAVGQVAEVRHQFGRLTDLEVSTQHAQVDSQRLEGVGAGVQ
jgi:hypothetical protein